MQAGTPHVFFTTVFRSIDKRKKMEEIRVVNSVCSVRTHSQCECCEFRYYYVIAMPKNQLKHEKKSILFHIALWLNVFRF